MQAILNSRYQILQVLGSGGFGDTFLAEDTHLPSRRRCVIKQLKPIHNNEQLLQLVQARFEREAALLEELGSGHSQIPNLYAYFSEGNQFYLVQEWIDGNELSKYINASKLLSESVVQEILLSLLPVLEFIHSQGIVHRDIKPDNIILRTRDNLPVLIDFGAVREIMGTVLHSSGSQTNTIVIGTPGFMASEQAAGRAIYASDIYSLGLTAICLLTGKLPQALETNPSTGEIVWRKYAKNISPNFANILDKAIRYYPRDRFSSASEMLKALQTPSNSHLATAVVAPAQAPISSSTSRKGLIIGSAILGSFLSTLLVFAWANNPSFSPTFPIPNSQSAVKPSPEEFIQNYYYLINAREYETSWKQLSVSFNNSKLSGNYRSYLDWWNSVERVSVESTQLISQDTDTAIVHTRLRYVMKTGRIASDFLQVSLRWDAQANNWVFEHTKILP